MSADVMRLRSRQRIPILDRVEIDLLTHPLTRKSMSLSRGCQESVDFWNSVRAGESQTGGCDGS